MEKCEAHKKENVDIELLKKEHPLVTDERCFNINWWPDTTPLVFQQEEQGE